MRKLLLNPTPLFRKLRQLSLLLSLLLALPQTAWGQGYFGINTTNKGTHAVESYEVTEATASDILGDDSHKITYDATSNILTLNDVDLEFIGTDAAFIAMVDGDLQSLTVRLIGENKLTLGGSTYLFYGTNVSFITDASSPGSLTITTTNWAGTIYKGYFSNDNYSVAYCDKLRMVHTDGQSTYTIQTVEPTGTDYGLTVAGTPVTSSNAADVLGNGKVSLDATTTPKKLSFTGRNYINYPGHCINTSETLEIGVEASGNLYLNSTGDGNYPFYSASDVQIQFSSDFDANIQGKNVPAFSPKCVPYFPVYSPNSTQTGPQIVYSDNGYTIKKYSGTEFLEFQIDGNYITSDNKSNILGDGSVSFADGTGSGTLTLNNANIGEVRYSGDYANLTINLTGTNYITKRFLDSFLLCYYGPSTTNPTLTFTGDGELRLQTDDANFTSADYDFVVDENGGTGDNIDYSANFTTGGWSKEYISAANSANGVPYLRIYKGTSTAYGLTIAGTTVTSANAANILAGDPTNDGKISFTPASNTLTLNGVTITPEGVAYGIKYTGTDNLSINLNGTNIVKGSGGCPAIGFYDNGSPTTTTPNLTFINGGTEPCSLQLEATTTPTIEGFGSVINTGLYKIEETITGNEGNTYKTTITSTILGGGSGSPDDPFIIATAADLKDFSSYVNKGWITTNGKYFKLSPSSGSTIDCTGLTGFQPIGIEGKEPIKFKGTFDGNEKTIKGLSITGVEGENVGLFRCLDGGTITQLTLDGCTISGGSSKTDDNYIGGIVGNVSSGTVSNCIVQNSTISCSENSQNPYVGGIVGNAASGTISNCQVKGTAEISAISTDQSTYAGAIAGNWTGVTLSNNTYDYSVKTKVQNSTITELTTYSGYTQRGIGSDANASTTNVDITESNGAVMYTKIVSLPTANSAGRVAGVDGTYYKVDGTSLYVAPGQTAEIDATPNTANNFALAWLQAVKAGTTDVISCDSIPNTGGGRNYTFVMPDTQVNIDVHFAIDLSADGITATIDDAFYKGEALEPTTLKVEGITGAAGVTSLTKGTDFTITGYTKGGVTVDAPVDAGDYIVQIEGKGNYIGTKNVSYKIWQTYALKVAGTQVNEKNAANVLGSVDVVKVSFTPATATTPNKLTLNGASFEGKIENGLDELTIEFAGTNSLNGTSGYITSTNNSAILTLKGVTNGTNPSTLSLTNTVGVTAVGGFASVTLNGAYLKTTNCCQYVSGDIRQYQSPHNNIPIQNITFTTKPHYLLWIRDYQVSDDNKDDIFNDTQNSDPISATFDPSSNILTLNGMQSYSQFGIESGLDNLTISLIGSNAVYATNYRGYNSILSIVDNATLKIQKAGAATYDCELDLRTYGEDPVIKGFKSVDYTGLNFVSKTGTTIDAETTYEGTLSSGTIYPLWIDGTMVTEANKSAILGPSDTSVTYDGDTNNGGTNTLTLNNYSYTGYGGSGHAIETNISGLKVKLVGASTINCTANSNYAFYTYLSTASIQFVKDDATSKLTLQTTPANPFGGFTDGNVTYDGLVYYSEGTYIAVPTAPTMAEDNNKVKLTINYSGGNVAIKYSIDYADETADVTEATYSEPFAMTAPGTVEAWVEANGATTENDKVKGKYFGFKDAPFTLKADLVDQSKSETLTPVLIPAFVDGENIALKTTGTYESSAEGVATFADGTITAKGIGTATVTANIDYTGDVQPVVILNHEKKVTAEVNVGVTPSITFTPDMKYATFCNTGNKDLTVPEGLKAYAITGVNGNVVTLSQVEFLPKVNGTTYFPLLLKREDKNTEVGLSLEYDGTASAPTSNYLRYAISNVQTTGVEFVLYKDEFVKATGTIFEQKCYLYLRGVSFTRGAYDIGDGTTAIDATLIDNEETNDYWYDLQGRRIQKPSKAGLYIKNGKKVIVNTK